MCLKLDQSHSAVRLSTRSRASAERGRYTNSLIVTQATAPALTNTKGEDETRYPTPTTAERASSPEIDEVSRIQPVVTPPAVKLQFQMYLRDVKINLAHLIRFAAAVR